MNLFPQLPYLITKRLASQAVTLPVMELKGRAANDHAGVIFTPVGGARIAASSLDDLRKVIISLAEQFGYPDSANPAASAAFDAAACVALFKLVRISPAEASKPGVWEFMSCVLLPDVVRWRFPSPEGPTSPARFLAGRRNTFQRLWWRAYHISHCQAMPDAELGRLLGDMGEDELVQLMERPALAGIFGLSAQVAKGLLAASQKTPIPRRILMREGQKRLLRISSFVSFDSISAEDSRLIIDRIFADVAASVVAE